MANLVTVKEIAQGAAVSVATVSRVLNNQANVRQEVRQRVLDTATSLGYFTLNGKTSQADARPPKPLKEIAFIYSSSVDSHTAIVNPFWLRILQGAEREANKSSIKTTYRSVNELAHLPQLLLNTIKELGIDGVLLVGPATAEVVRTIQLSGLPVVLVDNYIPQTSIDAVLSDNFEGARQAVEHLLDRGHQQIGFIGGPFLTTEPRPINKVYTIERRAAGYRTALLDAGLKVDYNLYEAANLTPDGGYQACKRLLERKAAFTALFCANDETAIGAMKALREWGLNIPGDVSIVGFDDIEMAEHYNPALTTVRVNKEGMGAAAIKTLIARANDPEAVSYTVMLEVELVSRHSVAPNKTQPFLHQDLAQL